MMSRYCMSFLLMGITIEIRRGGTDLRKKATGLFPVAFIDLGQP
jgi:hypothetical protein